MIQSRIHTIVIIAPQFHYNDKLIMVTVCVTCDTHYDELQLAHPFFSSDAVLFPEELLLSMVGEYIQGGFF